MQMAEQRSRNADCMNSPRTNDWLFPSLVELALDEGTIGDVLRSLPDWMLRAADRWAEQNHEAQNRRQVLGRLIAPDPWQFLIDAPAVSPEARDVFRAAQSHIEATRHIVGMALRRATLSTDWYYETVKAEAKGNKGRADHAKKRLADAMALYEPAQRHVREQAKADPKLSEQMEWWLKRRRAQLVHRGKGNEAETAKPFPKWSEIQSRFPLETMLVTKWVRFEIDGPPGLMFWRNEALTKLLLSLQNRTESGLPPHQVKKYRQRLGLIPVGGKSHFVWNVSVSLQSKGKWNVEGFRRNGEQVFGGHLTLNPD